MKPIAILSLLIKIISYTEAAEQKPNSTQFVPGAYLIEYEDSYDAASFISNLRSKRIVATPRLTISSDIFHGASYQFDSKKSDQDALKQLSNLPSVKNIWPIEKIHRPLPTPLWTGTDPSTIPADIRSQIAVQNGSFAPHILTQVDKLHAEGFTGKGIRIGIVDDGVDWKHHALGGCFGPGCRITHGYDLTGDYSQNSTYNPDPDPYADCQSHGTHVTGIIGAQKTKFGFTGAAPGAEIGMYRVFNCNGGTTNDVVAAGIVKAYEDGNHIISASLGMSSGWPEQALAVIAERIAAKGVILTLANGNDGYSGPFTAESPATGKGTLGVGSTSLTSIPRVLLNASYTIANETTKPFGWTHSYPDNWGNVSLPLYVGDVNGSMCDRTAWPTDLSGYVVLIKTDRYCADWYRAQFAYNKGARYILFFPTSSLDANSVIDISQPLLGQFLPQLKAIGVVTNSLAKEFVRLNNNKTPITVHITDPKSATQYVDQIQNPVQETLSPWSSWGPTFELDIKPDIITPGGYILSTYPERLGGYAVISGTSMATPLTAGIAALLLEARSSLSSSDIKLLLTTATKPVAVLNSTLPNPDLVPVLQQGPGLAQAWNAAHSSSIPSISKILLNDTDNFVKSHTFSIRNVGKETITYVLGHRPALTVYTFANDTTEIIGETVRSFANVSLAQNTISIGAGTAATVTVSVEPPAGLDAKRIPVYSGYITIDGSNGDFLSIPYLGAAGSLSTIPILDDFFLTGYEQDYFSGHAPPGTEYKLPNDPNNPNATYFPPWIRGNITFGTTLLNVEAYTTLLSNNTSQASLGTYLGPILGYPYSYVPWYGDYQDAWSGELKNGSRVPTGNYTLVISALKIFGDPKNKDDYQVNQTVSFGLKFT